MSNLVRLLFEHHQLLWDLAGDEISTVEVASPEWWLLFNDADWLAGWCTQIVANGSIREDELPQLRAFPALDQTGPHANWLLNASIHKRHLFAYVSTLEMIRLALLNEIGGES